MQLRTQDFADVYAYCVLCVCVCVWCVEGRAGGGGRGGGEGGGSETSPPAQKKKAREVYALRFVHTSSYV